MSDSAAEEPPTVWIARIDQDIGESVIIPTESRLMAEEHAEQFVEDTYGECLGRWHESYSDDGSLVAYTDDRKAIISEMRVRQEYPDGRSPLPA